MILVPSSGGKYDDGGILEALDRIAARGAPGLHAGARRRPGPRGGRRPPVPRRRLVGTGRVPRGRRLLRPQRLPDHEPPSRRMAERGPDRVVGVLGPPGPAPAPGAVPRPRLS